MKIVIAHTRGYGRWLRDCIKSLDPENLPYEVITIEPGGWVTDQLKYAGNLAAFWHESIFFINETTIWHKPLELFDQAVDMEGPVCLSPGYLSFQGKFTHQQLTDINWPEIKSKRDDVIKGEGQLLRDTLSPGLPVLCPDFVDPDPKDPNNFVTRYGRKNMVLKNQYLTKYKGHWDLPEV